MPRQVKGDCFGSCAASQTWHSKRECRGRDSARWTAPWSDQRRCWFSQLCLTNHGTLIQQIVLVGLVHHPVWQWQRVKSRPSVEATRASFRQSLCSFHNFFHKRQCSSLNQGTKAWTFDCRISNVWAQGDDSEQLEKAFEWHLAINTPVGADIQQTPEAGISLLCSTLWSICGHMSLHVLLQSCAIGDVEVESLWHSRVKAIVVVGGGSTSPLPACLTQGAVMLILLVSMATMRCEGSTRKWLQWRLCRQSSSFACHGNSDRRWIYSDLCTKPHLEPVKSSQWGVSCERLNIHSMQCVGAVEAGLINASKPSKWEKRSTVKSKLFLLKSDVAFLVSKWCNDETRYT